MNRIKLLLISCVTLTGCFWSSAASYPAPGDTMIFGRAPVTPTATHRLVWDEVSMCLGIEGRDISTVSWSVADSIITFDGYLAYGISFMPFASTRRDVIIERTSWYNFGIISHEAIHVHANVYDHAGEEWRCEQPSPIDLPLRRPREASRVTS